VAGSGEGDFYIRERSCLPAREGEIDSSPLARMGGPQLQKEKRTVSIYYGSLGEREFWAPQRRGVLYSEREKKQEGRKRSTLKLFLKGNFCLPN